MIAKNSNTELTPSTKPRGLQQRRVSGSSMWQLSWASLFSSPTFITSSFLAPPKAHARTLLGQQYHDQKQMRLLSQKVHAQAQSSYPHENSAPPRDSSRVASPRYRPCTRDGEEAWPSSLQSSSTSSQSVICWTKRSESQLFQQIRVLAYRCAAKLQGQIALHSRARPKKAQLAR